MNIFETVMQTTLVILGAFLRRVHLIFQVQTRGMFNAPILQSQPEQSDTSKEQYTLSPRTIKQSPKLN